ncbi:MAG: hypothetical protein ACD_54C00019G0001, partial [uncultured bacterium]
MALQAILDRIRAAEAQAGRVA